MDKLSHYFDAENQHPPEEQFLLYVDGELDAASAAALIDRLVAENLDMINAARVSQSAASYRRGHRFGNVMLTGIVAWIFGSRFTDMLSGYRVLSRRFVKCFPALTSGFEIETEISVHALELRMPVGELVTAYGARPEGSASKLSTYSDGWRILKTIATLYRVERPVLFYGGLAALLTIAAIIIAVPLLLTYLETGLDLEVRSWLALARQKLAEVVLLRCRASDQDALSARPLGGFPQLRYLRERALRIGVVAQDQVALVPHGLEDLPAGGHEGGAGQRVRRQPARVGEGRARRGQSQPFSRHHPA